MILFRFSGSYDDFETADDLLTTKATPRARQLQQIHSGYSKHSFDDSITTKKESHHSNYHLKEQYDDEMDYENDQEIETADTLVEMVDDDDSFVDEDQSSVIKYRSSTQKLNN